MRGAWLIAACASVGCWHETRSSTTGSLVADVRVQGQDLVVESCAIGYEVSETQVLWERSRSVRMDTSDCGSARVELPPGIDPPGAPPPVSTPAPPPPPVAPGALPEELYFGRAQVAARNGQCNSVVRYAAKVKAIAPDYYRTTFLADADVAACLRKP